MDTGIQQASGQAVVNPLPTSWLGLAAMPTITPDWANTQSLTAVQGQNLLAQIGYDLSQWDYGKIGANNQLGRYQFTTTLLETYGLLAVGSNLHYGSDCINYQACWAPVTVRKNTNSYAQYLHGVTSQTEFLSSTAGQDQLAYQIIYDLYNGLVSNTAIQANDGNDTVAGMIYCAWQLGIDGAKTWRYSGIGTGATAFNLGRYAITILSQ
jgi:hypothetical protein